MRIEQWGESERLRRLHEPQRGTIQRLVDAAEAVDCLHGVGHRQRRDRRAGFLYGGHRARQEIVAGEGAGGVVDEDVIGVAATQRLKAGADRGLAGRAAKDRGYQARIGIHAGG